MRLALGLRLDCGLRLRPLSCAHIIVPAMALPARFPNCCSAVVEVIKQLGKNLVMGEQQAWCSSVAAGCCWRLVSGPLARLPHALAFPADTRLTCCRPLRLQATWTC